ncbi:hypothetical protein [Butyrivibrio sp. YAB3001]|uniref:hypothetical protein n=1 Tax=Butyrivibrio sp. YAB3001 TaxID=1520812 RepID=UPI0008F660CA|nr:hypothetical protein [Butyrivibrio sp. YAB3001]SFC56686.1 hypothetical protein SAMN02910398_02588 [Butyrivibrio sp. YAB3001]
MSDLDYAKSVLIYTYSELASCFESDYSLGYGVDEVCCLFAINDAINAMCCILALEKGYRFNARKQFVHEEVNLNGTEVILADENVPEYLKSFIDNMYKYIVNSAVGYMESEEEVRVFSMLLTAYDKFCIYFWSNTKIRESLTEEESHSLKECFRFVGETEKNIEELIQQSIIAPLHEKISIVDEKTLEEQLTEISEQLKDVQKGIGAIDRKVDNIEKKIVELGETLTANQGLITRILNGGYDEEQKDRLLRLYADEIVQRIDEKLSVQYPNNIVKEEEDNLIKEFGEAWNKLTNDSKKFIVSAKVMYKKQEEYGDLMDYSGVCVLITKALEVEMSIRFHKRFIDFLMDNGIGVKEYPSSLIKDGRVISPSEYTLGSVPFTLGYRIPRNASKAEISNNQKKLLEYSKASLITNRSDSDILNLLKTYGNQVERIKKDYRNPSAHTNALRSVNAKECLDLVIDVKKVLKNMLDSFEK